MTEEERTVEQAQKADLDRWINAMNRAFAIEQNLTNENQRLRARIAELEAGHVVE